MKTLALILITILSLLSCAPSTANSLYNALGINFEKRTRIVGPRGTFNTQAISHPSGGWPVAFLLQQTKVSTMSAVTWKVRVVVNGDIELSEYPRKSKGLLDIAIFRTRHDTNYRSQECLTQLLTGISFQPGTEAEFILDTSKFTDASGSIVFEHYRGYSIYLDAYDTSGSKLAIDGNGGVMIGPTPYVPNRVQPATALVNCD